MTPLLVVKALAAGWFAAGLILAAGWARYKAEQIVDRRRRRYLDQLTAEQSGEWTP